MIRCTATPRWDGKCWKVNVQRDRVRKSFYSSQPGRKGKAQCISKAEKWLSLRSDSDPITIDAVDEFVGYKKAKVSSSYMASFAMWRNRVCEQAFASKRISRVCDMDWQGVLDKAARDGKATRTVYNLRAMTLEFLRYCKKNRWISEVTDSLQITEGKAKKQQVILQPKDIKVLFSSDMTTKNGVPKKEWWIHYYRLAVITGMRRGQIAGLQWQDISDDCINISRSINHIGQITAGKNKNARRSVPLTPSAKAELQAQKKQLEEKNVKSLYVFPQVCGKPCDPNEVQYAWTVYLKANGLDPRVTIHNLRRTMISMHKQDMPIQLLKQVVGHSMSMDTFGVYGRQMEGQTEQARDIMQSALASIIAD